MSCTKAKPNLTSTFCVIFCTGRMSLLYPLKRSRTRRSSSSLPLTLILIFSTNICFFFCFQLEQCDRKNAIMSENQQQLTLCWLVVCWDNLPCWITASDNVKIINTQNFMFTKSFSFILRCWAFAFGTRDRI